MVYDRYFRFIKDELINPNEVFIQNVDNFLFSLYCDYMPNSTLKKQTKRIKILLVNLFRNIKASLMGISMSLGFKRSFIMEKNKELQKEIEEKDEEIKRMKEGSIELGLTFLDTYPNIIEELVDKTFKDSSMDYSEIFILLNLYCILVKGLEKTTGEKFDKIKKEMQPLINFLKEIFCAFDKSEIHKERTLLFTLRSPEGAEDEYYFLNNKDNMLMKSLINNDVFEYKNDDEDEVKFMDFEHYTKLKENKKIIGLYWEKDERNYDFRDNVLALFLNDGKNYHRL